MDLISFPFLYFFVLHHVSFLFTTSRRVFVLPDRQRVMCLDTNTLIHTTVPNNINNSSWGKWLNIYQLSFWQSKFVVALFACSIQYNRPVETLETNTKLKSLPDVWHRTQALLRQTSCFSLRHTSNYWSEIDYFLNAGAPGSLLISNLRFECCIKTTCKWHAGGAIENKPNS